jgi:hypothetical protein
VSRDEQDERANCILVAGALTAAIAMGGIRVEPEVGDDGQVTGDLFVRPDIVRSQYRIRIERVPDTEREGEP